MTCAECGKITGTYHLDNGQSRPVDTVELLKKLNIPRLTDDNSCSEWSTNANNSFIKDCDRKHAYCMYLVTTLKTKRNEEAGKNSICDF